jgi:maltose O-acetyltransferase
MMKAEIGLGSNIFMGTTIDSPGGLVIGRNTVINQDCRLDTRGGLSIGDNVSISAGVCILTASHDMQSEDCVGFVKGVAIDDYVFIGTRALILPGVSIGKGAVVGAGALVSKSVEPYSIVAGVPSKVIGHRNQNLNYSASYPRLFH